MGRLLVLDVLPKDGHRGSAARRRKVGRRPQNTASLQPRMEVPELLPQHPARYPLQRRDERGHCDLRRVVNQQVDVVVLAVELY